MLTTSVHPRLQRLGLIEARRTSATRCARLASHPRLQRLGLIEAGHPSRCRGSLSRHPRLQRLGLIEASTSKRRQPWQCRIRGFNASASLKPIVCHLVCRARNRIRGFNASASLKPHGLDVERPVKLSIRGFNASASLKPPIRKRFLRRPGRHPRLQRLGLIEACLRRRASCRPPQASEASTPRPH